MNRLPQLGEGVRVPWGLDEVPGEVIDVVPPHHAVVDVVVEGASEEALSTSSVRVRVDALKELERWRVVGTRKGAPTAGADATLAWWVQARRGRDEARVEVRLSGSAAAVSHLPDEAAAAVRSHGRSAVEKFAFRYRLPRTIVVGTTGVFEASA